MSQVREKTQVQENVVVQKNWICNYGQARYKLANALDGTSGYSLTREFVNAVGHLPTSYSVTRYTEFLDDWGTVSCLLVRAVRNFLVKKGAVTYNNIIIIILSI